MPNMLGPDRRRVAIIGAGIIGTTIALVLQGRGCQVTLIDKDDVGMGCSYGHGGAISPDFCVPFSLPGMLKRVPGWLFDPEGPLVIRWRNLPRALPWLLRWIQAADLERVKKASTALRALHAPSLERYAQLLGHHADGLIEKTGQLYVWKSAQAGPTEEIARALRASHGVPTQALTPAQIGTIDPQLAPEFTRGMFFPDNGHTVNPLRLVQTLADLFQRAGGRLERANAIGLDRLAGGGGDEVRSVRCDNGTVLDTDAVVIAAGIASTRFSATLGDKVCLQAERGYHVMLPDPHVRPAIKISNRDQMFGMTPMEHGVRISGTVEIAAADAPMDERRPRAMLAHAKRMYPGLNDVGATFWMGSRPSTPDSLPVIARAARTRNVVYAFGHGHTGATGAPMTADLVAHWLAPGADGAPPPIDPAPYRADRFSFLHSTGDKV